MHSAGKISPVKVPFIKNGPKIASTTVDSHLISSFLSLVGDWSTQSFFKLWIAKPLGINVNMYSGLISTKLHLFVDYSRFSKSWSWVGLSWVCLFFFSLCHSNFAGHDPYASSIRIKLQLLFSFSLNSPVFVDFMNNLSHIEPYHCSKSLCLTTKS